jgi:hypothetical protein
LGRRAAVVDTIADVRSYRPDGSRFKSVRTATDNSRVVPRVRRRFLAALTVALVGAAGYVVVPPVVASIQAEQARANLDAADAAFAHLKVPANFRSVPADEASLACGEGVLCYVLAKPTVSVTQASLVGILRHIGAKIVPVRSLVSPAGGACGTTVRSHLERGAPRNPRVVKQCLIYGRLDGLYTYISLQPYNACRLGWCGITDESEIWISPPFVPTNDN